MTTIIKVKSPVTPLYHFYKIAEGWTGRQVKRGDDTQQRAEIRNWASGRCRELTAPVHGADTLPTELHVRPTPLFNTMLSIMVLTIKISQEDNLFSQPVRACAINIVMIVLLYRHLFHAYALLQSIQRWRFRLMHNEMHSRPHCVAVLNKLNSLRLDLK